MFLLSARASSVGVENFALSEKRHTDPKDILSLLFINIGHPYLWFGAKVDFL